MSNFIFLDKIFMIPTFNKNSQFYFVIEPENMFLSKV